MTGFSAGEGWGENKGLNAEGAEESARVRREKTMVIRRLDVWTAKCFDQAELMMIGWEVCESAKTGANGVGIRRAFVWGR